MKFTFYVLGLISGIILIGAFDVLMDIHGINKIVNESPKIQTVTKEPNYDSLIIPGNEYHLCLNGLEESNVIVEKVNKGMVSYHDKRGGSPCTFIKTTQEFYSYMTNCNERKILGRNE